MADMATMAKANPIFRTAIGTTIFLAKAGDPIAKEYIEAMHMPLPGLDAEPLQTGNEMMPANGYSVPLKNYVLTIEYRHKMMNQMIFDSGYKNLLDLACGYTPRAIRMAERGINYVGGDLPIVIESIAPLAKARAAQFPTVVEYRETDVTNPEAMNAAADILKGEMCIVTEGLLGYLQNDELQLLCSNIKSILERHGGAWIFMDMCYDKLEAAVSEAQGQNGSVMSSLSKAGGAQASDTANMKLTADEDTLKKFLSECGLTLKMVPFYSDQVHLNMEKFLTEEERELLHEKLKKLEAWVVTGSGPEKAVDNTEVKSVKSNETGSTLTISGSLLKAELCGRIDSMSAPDLLQMFESISGDAEFDEVKVDAKNLDYISSAGLRVLLMMIKASKEQKMSVDNASDTVREIFETTGFANMMQYIK